MHASSSLTGEKSLDKRIIVGLVIVVVVIAAVFTYIVVTKPSEEPPPLNGEEPLDVENVGGKYNTNITRYEGYAQIEYKDEEGIHSDMHFMVELKDVFEWIKIDTPEASMFLCWWDYGHMIKGYAERNVVIRNPSEEILDTVADPSGLKEFDSHEQILDVAIALTTNNFSEMTQIIEKYGVTHIFTPSRDIIIAPTFYDVAELDWTDYLEPQDSGFEFTEAGMQTMISKLLENRELPFGLIYEDSEIKVYEVE
jgi:asparagine N-glycosylation enzyme membrane subunit Stt3